MFSAKETRLRWSASLSGMSKEIVGFNKPVNCIFKKSFNGVFTYL